MANDQILLDTTVQLWRIVYGREEAEKFNKDLRGKAEVYSTSFVFREFLNTIIADLELVHRLASSSLQPEDDGLVSLAQLARFLGTGKGNYSTRSVRRLHLVTGMLLESFDRTRVSKRKLLVRLERTARRFINEFFKSPGRNGEQRDLICLTGIDDQTGELERMRLGRPFPPQPAFPKAAALFLEENREQVVRVEEIMSNTTKAKGRDDKLLKALGWLKAANGHFDFLDKLKRYKLWNWALGDLLIALESPETVAIYSTDRTFSVLAYALDKPRYAGYRTPE